MHVRDLLELAAVVATHATTGLHGTAPPPSGSLEAYWTASKARLDRWGHGIKRYTSRTNSRSAFRGREVAWLATRPVIEEIFLAEVLTRVWTAVLVADDRRRGTQEGEPIGRSVLVGHLEARHRAMHLLVHDAAVDAGQAVALNRLRRRAERWTDLLIGRLLSIADVREFAFNPRHAREFCLDLARQQREGNRNAGWSVVLSAMRGTFADGLDESAANPDLNAAIANSILARWSPEQFDATGLLRTAWLARMSATTNDTQQLIEHLLAADGLDAEPAPPTGVSAFRRASGQERFRG